MLRIGITGGMGSGKSTVCQMFSNLGVPVFSSDHEGRKLLNNDQEVIDKVREKFGSDMYTTNGSIDRERIGRLVFSDPKALESLSKIVHPKVNEAFNYWTRTHERSAYVLKEAAILFESGYYHDLDKIITVFAPKEVRIERVMKRDGMNKQDIEKRMLLQYTDEERNKLADFIIINDHRSKLLEQVMELHEILLNESKW